MIAFISLNIAQRKRITCSQITDIRKNKKEKTALFITTEEIELVKIIEKVSMLFPLKIIICSCWTSCLVFFPLRFMVSLKN